MSLFLNPLPLEMLLLLLLFNACSMKNDDDFCCWCCWLCACKLFWKWFCCCCCCRCRRALCRWLVIFGCVVWKSGDEEDVVDGEGVGVGGGAIGEAPHVWIFSNGFLKLFVSPEAVPFDGNDPYARNMLNAFLFAQRLLKSFTHSLSTFFFVSCFCTCRCLFHQLLFGEILIFFICTLVYLDQYTNTEQVRWEKIVGI